MSEFNTGQPSTRRIQKIIQEKGSVQIKLISGDSLQGKVIWQDSDCVCIKDESDQDVMIWKTSILYLKP